MEETKDHNGLFRSVCSSMWRWLLTPSFPP